MPSFTLTAHITLEMVVDAADAAEAGARAEGWVNWVEPTFEQFLDYGGEHDDHGLQSEGTFSLVRMEVTGAAPD